MSNTGTVKRYNPSKGFGFITTDDGKDIFLHISGMADGKEPRQGDVVTFDLEPSARNAEQMQATNVNGGSGEPGVPEAKGTGLPGEHQGVVKSFSNKNGFGFVVGPDGSDIFVHINGCVDQGVPQVGDTINFDIAPSWQKEGQFMATNVTGGTGTQAAAKGDAKGAFGKGFGKDAKGKDAWGKGDAWGKAGGWGKGDAWDAWGGKGDMWGKGDPWGCKGAWGPYGGKDMGFGKGCWGKGDPWGCKGPWDAKGGKKGWGGKDAAWDGKGCKGKW